MTNIKQTLIICITSLMCFSSCKTDDIDTATFEIAPKNLALYIEKESTTVYVPINSTLSINDWEVENNTSWITFGKKKNSLVLSFEDNKERKTRKASVKISSPIAEYTLTVDQYGLNDVVINNTVQVIPIDAYTNQEQTGYEIENTFDGIYPTGPGIKINPYHSPWGTPTTSFPVDLDYYLSGNDEIEYFIYHPHNGNGNFGQLEVYTATDVSHSNYTLQGEYDFKMQGTPSKIRFTTPVKATAVRFRVKSGGGDVVSCAEMQFFKKNTENSLDQKLLAVFTDVTCSELKADVTNEAIQALPDYFARIAKELKDNTYNEWEKEFRIQNYQAYSDSETWAKKLITKRYTNLDNPTGISVKPGDEIIVLVGNTHGQNVSLQCIGEDKNDKGELQVAATGDYYMLEPGVNKFTMGPKSNGQLFVMYNADITKANAQPIKIHIPLGSGKVSGFFDATTHHTDQKYAELLSKATHKYFCIRGEKIMFYFHTSELRQVVGNKILPSLAFWNDIIKWQQELMGIEDVVPSQMNNHVFAISPEYGYMWASELRIGFAKSTLYKILNPEKLMAEEDNVWGPAHEIGHIHQGAIDWASTRESSNNLFSNYIHYKLGKYNSRGADIYKLASSYREKKPWVLLGDNTSYQNEDPDLHMRMNWQLWNYFHRLGNMPDFFPKLFKKLRTTKLTTAAPGTAQLEYVKAVCEVANMDMTEFFDRWGFFHEVSIPKYEQYGTYSYLVTAMDIMITKSMISALYPKKVPPIYYLEDRKSSEVDPNVYKIGDVGHYSQFKENAQITTPPTYKLSGRTITISNGNKAVAFEIRKGNENGELLDFFNFLTYNIPVTVVVDSTTKYYAVQADGKKVEMKNE